VLDLTAAPSHYHSHRLLKDRQFSNTEVAKDTMHMWLQKQEKIFSADKIRKLMDISNKCVENVMNHFEK